MKTSTQYQRCSVRNRRARSQPRFGLTAGVVCALLGAGWPIAGLADSWLSAIEQRDTQLLAASLATQVDVDRSGDDGRTALMVAASAGDVRLLERLVNAGADVDRRNRGGGTALMFAAQYGQLACAERLITAGADVNLIGVKGFTALMIAVLKNRPTIVRLVLANGADPNLVDAHGWTALQRAVASQRGDIVRDLLAHPAINVDHRNGDGVTALHLAAAGVQLATAQALLRHGADPRAGDAQGNTALSLATDAGHAELVQTLRTVMEQAATPTR